MRIKICGITRADQGVAIANFGATALGFICVPQSPRYLTPEQLAQVTAELPSGIGRVGVFANTEIATIVENVRQGQLTAVQLHGQESTAFCQQVRAALTGITLIKALRIRSSKDLAQAYTLQTEVDVLLLDAYHPQQLGGTGQTLDWQSLRDFRPSCPWWLAGGLTPQNIRQALSQLQPDGIDLSSGVERAPGDKDLAQVAQLFQALRQR